MKRSILLRPLAVLLLVLLVPFTLPHASAQGTPIPTESWGDVADTSWYNAAEEVFYLDTAQQLAGLAVLVNSGNTLANKTLYLSSDIDLSGRRWVPIGTKNTHTFAGTLDGNGYRIKGLTMDRGTEVPEIPTYSVVYAGLFGYSGTASGGAILNNLHLVDLYICHDYPASGADYVGGLIAYSTGGSITNCSVQGTISVTVATTSADSGASVGGIIASSTKEISNCESYVDIYVNTSGSRSYSGNSGGIAGQSRGKVDNCHNYGSITIVHTAVSDNYAVGGVVGYMHSQITNSSNHGAVALHANGSGVAYAGGVTGRAYPINAQLLLRNCYNTGDVSTTANATYNGGVVGKVSEGTVENCYNTGTIWADVTKSVPVYSPYGCVGGIAGYTYHTSDASASTFRNCYNTGDVHATIDPTNNGRVGGAFGTGFGWFDGILNTGDVYLSGSKAGTLDAHAGGLVGSLSFANGGYIRSSFSTGNVIHDDTVLAAPLVGRQVDGAVIEQCYRYSNSAVNGALSTVDDPNSVHGGALVATDFWTKALYESVGWDFETIWTWDTDAGYPKLSGLAHQQYPFRFYFHADPYGQNPYLAEELSVLILANDTAITDVRYAFTDSPLPPADGFTALDSDTVAVPPGGQWYLHVRGDLALLGGKYAVVTDTFGLYGYYSEFLLRFAFYEQDALIGYTDWLSVSHTEPVVPTPPEGYAFLRNIDAVSAEGLLLGAVPSDSALSIVGNQLTLELPVAEILYYTVTFLYDDPAASYEELVLPYGAAVHGDMLTPPAGYVLAHPLSFTLSEESEAVYEMHHEARTAVVPVALKKIVVPEPEPSYSPSPSPTPSPSPSPSPSPELREEPFVSGFPDGSFGPGIVGSRAQAAQMLYNLFGSPVAEHTALDAFPGEVSKTHWARDALAWAVSARYLRGTDLEALLPQHTITRGEMAALLARILRADGLDGGKSAHTSRFQDIAGHWAEQDIVYLEQLGVVHGYLSGRFAPDSSMTRAEMVAMISRAAGRSSAYAAPADFPDLPDSHWAYSYIMNAAQGT